MNNIMHLKRIPYNKAIANAVAFCCLAGSLKAYAFIASPEQHLNPQYLSEQAAHHAETHSQSQHDTLHIPDVKAFKKLDGLRPALLQKALQGYKFAALKKQANKPYLVIVDYGIPSDKPRLWIFNLSNKKLIAHLRVAHGANSGTNIATHFSNKINSHMSCLGIFVTGSSYQGQFGYSLHLKGLQPGINDHTYQRHIVIHPGKYVGDKAVRAHSEAGKTWGCLALDPLYEKQVVNIIKNGSVIQSFA